MTKEAEILAALTAIKTEVSGIKTELAGINTGVAVHHQLHKGIDSRIKSLVDIAVKHNDVLYGNGRAGLITKVRFICWSFGLGGIVVGGAGGHFCTKFFGG